MRLFAYLATLWPGLPPLWQAGDPRGLATAIAFTITLNLAILATGVWDEWLSVGLTRACWLATVGIWCSGLVWNLRWLGRQTRVERPAEVETLFVTAQAEYLAGRLVECERTLERLLRIDPRDVEASLLLATLLTHADRTAEATARLQTLAACPGAGVWSSELAALARAIEASKADPNIDTPSDDGLPETASSKTAASPSDASPTDTSPTAAAASAKRPEAITSPQPVGDALGGVATRSASNPRDGAAPDRSESDGSESAGSASDGSASAGSPSRPPSPGEPDASPGPSNLAPARSTGRPTHRRPPPPVNATARRAA